MSLANPELVRFCNEQLRPAANTVAALDPDSARFLRLWDAWGIAGLLGTDPAAVIDDHAAADGRPILTVGKVLAFKAVVDAIRANCDANGGALVTATLAVAPNPQ